MKFDPQIQGLLWSQVLVQIALFFIGGALDMGEAIWGFIYGAITFLITAVIIVLRRPSKLTKWDIFFLRYGLVTISLVCWVTVSAVWHYRT